MKGELSQQNVLIQLVLLDILTCFWSQAQMATGATSFDICI